LTRQEEIHDAVMPAKVVLEDGARREPPLERQRRIRELELGDADRNLDEQTRRVE
jgi:hypothetical protein